MLAAVFAAAALAAGAPNPIQTENALGRTQPSEWLPPAVPTTAIDGWASQSSVLPGDQVQLHVSTTDGNRYRVELYRLGWYGSLGHASSPASRAAEATEPASTMGWRSSPG